MLVVGDTYLAITDPLRYHSRISGLKSWILIAITWFVSILFCIASALRRDCRLITIEITSTLQKIHWMGDDSELTTPATTPAQIMAASNRTTSMTGDSVDDIYNLVYSCTFFIIIILLPIVFVCAMYFRIFNEARQNGLRMRQNGSSPLLQSALNLATASAHLAPAQLDHCCTVIGEEDSDNGIDSLASSNLNVLHSTMRRNSMASPVHHVSIKDPIDGKTTSLRLHSSAQKLNRRYLEIPKFNEAHSYHLTMSISQNCNGDISSDESSAALPKRPIEKSTSANSSPRMFNHVYSPLQMDTVNELRQVHSTPDLQKSIHTELLLAGGVKNSNDKKIHSTGSIHKHSSNHSARSLSQRAPSICAPPKNYMSSIRHRLSNASSIFKYREESRAARISILVVIMFLFSYFPYGLLVLLQGRATFYANSSFLGVLFLLIANMTSPFIFAYRNRRVRRGVCRLFGVDAKTNERLQKQRMIMRNSLHANSCRERKHRSKIVRITRNSAKSASFSNSTLVPCKYTQVPLSAGCNEDNVKFKAVESAVLMDSSQKSAQIVAIVDSSRNIECRGSMLTSCDGLESSDECSEDCSAVIVVNCNNNCNSSSNKCDQSIHNNNSSNEIDDAVVAKYVKDIVNNINCVNGKSDIVDKSTSLPPQISPHNGHLISNSLNLDCNVNNNSINSKSNSNCIHNNNNNNNSLGKNSNVNNKLNGTNCSIGTATGANVIKQKISLLRRVCKTTAAARKNNSSNNSCSSPTHEPPTTVNHHFYFDGSNTATPVNV